jgi:hypothetical protein
MPYTNTLHKSNENARTPAERTTSVHVARLTRRSNLTFRPESERAKSMQLFKFHGLPVVQPVPLTSNGTGGARRARAAPDCPKIAVKPRGAAPASRFSRIGLVLSNGAILARLRTSRRGSEVELSSRACRTRIFYIKVTKTHGLRLSGQLRCTLHV